MDAHPSDASIGGTLYSGWTMEVRKDGGLQLRNRNTDDGIVIAEDKGMSRLQIDAIIDACQRLRVHVRD
ncbi:hypothetical protein [Burkholderia phage vB_BpP_HN03]